MARVLYGLYANDQEPMTPEEIAREYGLSLNAVAEAIAYCQTDPPEIRADWEMEEASIQAMVRKNPGYLQPAMTNPPKAAS